LRKSGIEIIGRVNGGEVEWGVRKEREAKRRRRRRKHLKLPKRLNAEGERGDSVHTG
jgi:hypothetical protein